MRDAKLFVADRIVIFIGAPLYRVRAAAVENNLSSAASRCYLKSSSTSVMCVDVLGRTQWPISV
jgi:hypothetical protein